MLFMFFATRGQHMSQENVPQSPDNVNTYQSIIHVHLVLTLMFDINFIMSLHDLNYKT